MAVPNTVCVDRIACPPPFEDHVTVGPTPASGHRENYGGSKDRQDAQYRRPANPELARCRGSTRVRSGAPRPDMAVFSYPDANLGARGERQLVEDVFDVRADRSLGDHEPFGDLPIAETLRDETGDLPLAWR